MDRGARAWWLVGAASLVFASPLRETWMRDEAPWWVGFALWAALVAAAALLLGRRRGDDA
jgi:hypothetical protein